jgi:hypothetical protein
VLASEIEQLFLVLLTVNGLVRHDKGRVTPQT